MEIKKSLSADHKITDVIKKAGERWKSLPADDTQKMDAMEISYKLRHSQHDDGARIRSVVNNSTTASSLA